MESLNGGRAGWLGLFAGLGFAGSLLICKRNLSLAAGMFVMAWLLMCINIADSAFMVASVYSSSDLQLPRTDEAIFHALLIWRICLTMPVVLMPLFLLRRELLQRVFRTRLARLFYFFTLCDSVLLVLMIRYLFTRTPLM